ncbi:MAG: DUF2283 domain-containing protein [Acidimicrobiales bacterium]
MPTILPVDDHRLAGTARCAARRPGTLWWSPRALRLHLTALTVAAGFLALGWWQLQRALSGNELSWAYTVEWPLFSGIVVVVWWHLLHNPPERHDRLEVHPAELKLGDTAFNLAAYDAGADALYLRVAADTSSAEVSQSPEGHTLRFDERGRLVGLTLMGVASSRRRGELAQVTVRRQGGDERIDVDPEALASALAVLAPPVAAGRFGGVADPDADYVGGGQECC